MDIRKLQRAIVDGLEDVKAQDIVVFNTTHLSSLFERVIIASGNSNRQTKALASSVREAVKAIGAPVPRMEGEDNGEWIIVDCGQAVCHIMQPAIRQYYHLEEIWGGKAVKMKIGGGKTGLVKAEAAEEDEDEDVPSTPKPAKTRVRRTATADTEAGQAALAGAKPAKAPARKKAAAEVDAPAAKAPRKTTRRAKPVEPPVVGTLIVKADGASSRRKPAIKPAAKPATAPKSASRAAKGVEPQDKPVEKPAAPKPARKRTTGGVSSAAAAPAAPARKAAPRKTPARKPAA
ncbi:ribosome silencing factor [Ideonella livida]|uniref:Ribosomal silencing factor RsfS n=1 Tax=Ideonella livida TaxID=2707176 RepID=A0A7C9PF23_9BURK|nr:ribosome silencing factor [Ideonella livida]NDY90215.1 ribosome silencing factor [Ideonella livida]